jgi:branched-chain amino acid transport system permease protein
MATRSSSVARDNAALLTVRGITKRFGGLAALRDVSLQVDRGEIRGLIGPNGAGKSTLLHIVSGFVAPTTGTFALDGQALTGRKGHEVATRGVARTFQHLALFGGMTVLENVMVGLHRQMRGPLPWLDRGEDTETAGAEAARALLRRHGLDGVAGAEIDTLSVGQRKRVELVRALAARPRLLLLDEPAAGLAADEIKELIVSLRELRDRDGLTIVLVEHIMELVMSVCDRITVLSFGEVLAEGSPEHIRADAGVIDAYLGKGAV